MTNELPELKWQRAGFKSESEYDAYLDEKMASLQKQLKELSNEKLTSMEKKIKKSSK